MAPFWTPSWEQRGAANLTAFARSSAQTAQFAETFDYAAMLRWSVEHRAAFWSQVWDFCGVIGEKGDCVLQHGKHMPGSNWFPNATLNFAENLLRDRPDDTIAIVFWNEEQGNRSISFRELKQSVASVASYFREQGVTRGDRIAAYTHNGPEAVIAMLACASIGALWSSCSSDFGVQGAFDRFGQIEPKVLIVSDGYFYKGQKVERLDRARELSSKLSSVECVLVIPNIDSCSNLQGFPAAKNWQEVVSARGQAALFFEPLPFNHPLYIMFSSGTTGAPKCIVHGVGGTLLQHLKEHQLQCDVKPGDRVFHATTTGWMMWNWLASALASKATLLLYDGFVMARRGAVLFDFAEEERATLFGVSAAYLKGIEKLGLTPRNTHRLSALKLITSTGSPLSPGSFDYVFRQIDADIQLSSMSGGTDIISCFVCGNPWGPVYRGEIQGAGLGMAVEVWDEDGRRRVGREGELVCVRSFPSMPLGFWNDADRQKYSNAYFSRYPGVWRHGDYATETPNGGFIIHGRSDATLNVQGVRIGTAEIYNIVETMPEIAEALAVDQQGEAGSRFVLFVKMKSGAHLDEALTVSLKRKLSDEASPRHAPSVILEAPDLPRTRSGKLVELAVREIIHGRAVTNAEALANPECLNFFKSHKTL